MSINYKQLLIGLEERGMPVAELAKLADLDGIRFASKTRLNEAFRETEPIPLRGETGEQVLKLWLEVEAMIHDAYVKTPWATMDLSDGARVHTSLQIFRGLRALCGREDNNDESKKAKEN